MKFPNHILLDVSKSSLNHSNQYWIFQYIFSFKSTKHNSVLNNMSSDLTLQKKFILRKEDTFSNNLMSNQSKFSIKYNYSNPALFLNQNEKSFFNKFFETRQKIKHVALKSTYPGKSAYDFMNSSFFYDEKMLKRLLKNFLFQTKTPLYKSNKLWSLFDINFLRKERIYTKLKYSRVPQYDIVSGGAAALFAGFLGFLICEKFGFELVDSGDFYFLFMYLVFLFFFCRLFLKIVDIEKTSWNLISLKWLIYFYKNLVILFVKSIKNLFNK